jgi:hypothetical protein
MFQDGTIENLEGANGQVYSNQRFVEVGDIVIYQRGLTCFRFKIEVIRQNFISENSRGYVGYSSVWLPALNKWIREDQLVLADK